MPDSDRDREHAIREAAYFIWLREGRPEGRAHDHWQRAISEVFGDEYHRAAELLEDEERILAGRADANWPALLTKDAKGG
jgi:hypothetical protein